MYLCMYVNMYACIEYIVFVIAWWFIEGTDIKVSGDWAFEDV